MAQLIIVTISIVMTSALAMIGLQYVGGPFIDGKDRAIALQYVAQGAQIATAWKSWSRASGKKVLMQIDWLNGSTELVPDYLSQLPPLALPATGLNQWLPFYLDAVSGTGTGNSFHSVNANVNGLTTWLEQTKRGHRICQQVINLSQGNGTSPVLAANNANIRPRNNAQYDCFIFDANSNGAVDVGTDQPIIVYRVF